MTKKEGFIWQLSINLCQRIMILQSAAWNVGESTTKLVFVVRDKEIETNDCNVVY